MRFPLPFTALAIAALGLLAGAAHAQSAADSLARQLRRYQQQALTEQLYVHHDRPAYAAGETMWLKVYAVDGTQHKPLSLSKVAYVELLDAARRPVLQAKLALRNALGQGTLVLPAELPGGRYVLRAYTSWMKNAGPDYYFQAPISIVNTWQPAAAPPASAAPALDLQFFPEGGQLVAGVPNRLGFKATGALGRGAAVAGTVADERGTVVASFQSLRAGMGSFSFTPTLGVRYAATVALPGGQKLTLPLPAAAAQGYALQLSEAGPSLTVRVQARPTSSETLYLVAHTGQHVAATETAATTGGQAVFQVDARQLPPGISHLTVFAGRRPVAERLYFKRPTAGQLLAVRGQAGAANYAARSHATVQVQAPQPAAASLAVYRLDSLAASSSPADIAAALLLAADLPGYVEDAGYYLRDSSATARQATDNLLLTQGWRRFRWEDVLAGTAPPAAYPPELNGFQLQGRVREASGAPAPGKVAYLSLPGQVFWFGNAASEADGRVRFEVPNLYGVRKLVLQPNSATADSLLRVELLSPFTAGGGLGGLGLATAPLRWATSLSERHLAVQTQRAYPAPAPQFQPVPGDTVAFYGRPDEFFLLDEYTRFPTVEDVMREYVPAVLVRKRRDGFHFVVIDRPRHINLKENPLTLLDGLPVFNINQIMAFDPLKIKRLDVMANRYFLGSQTYDGVVSYRTYKGDLGGFPLNPRALIEEYEGLQVPREFYAPRYDTDQRRQSRLPDLRNLLYWNPDLRLGANQPQTLDFFTGDQTGRYLVVVQGLGADGKPGSTSFSFEVKPTL